ncbi:iron-containing redox enzyme family protein [Streptomyces sp. NPDC052396]|uniref:iron-containing redox enzyme family protein n=1 Tax=Streptomyces sp. NPDC052396 TaxID=3365689 RepID=UPI0037D637D2
MRAPLPRGEISAALIGTLTAGEGPLPRAGPADPYGDDLQLALYTCYELHYRGVAGVSDDWEWDPGLLRLRGELENLFLTALRSDVPTGAGVAAALEELVLEPRDSRGLSHFLCDHGELWQLREYAVHRSLYQLKEADPHAWMIPRLTGRAKAALVAVEYDEFGAGRAERVHARLFAGLMRDLGLDDSYGHYLDAVPASTLATVNLMSLFGLHRASRGALAGHFATVESLSPPASRRLVQALQRLGAGPAAVHFYAEHVEADAVHEQLVRHDLVGDLLRREPRLAADVEFGILATRWLDERFETDVLAAWQSQRSSLRSQP